MDREFRGRNHYAARGYLKHWSVDGNSIQAYRTLVSHEDVPLWQRQSISSITRLEHLYAHLVSGELSDSVERWLADHVDSPSAAVLDRVSSEARLRPKDYESLIRFFAASHARTPGYLARRMVQMQREAEPMLQRELERVKAKLANSSAPAAPELSPPRPAGLDWPFRTRVRGLGDGRTMVLEAKLLSGRLWWLHEIVRFVQVAPRLFRSAEWSIYRAPAGCELLTSDDPAVVGSISADRSVTLGGAVPGEPAFAFVPLGPRHLLLASRWNRRPQQRYAELSEDMFAFVQRSIVRNALRYVFAKCADGWVQTERPRRVDAAQLQREREEFANYSRVQAEAERALDDDSVWPAASAFGHLLPPEVRGDAPST